MSALDSLGRDEVFTDCEEPDCDEEIFIRYRQLELFARRPGEPTVFDDVIAGREEDPTWRRRFDCIDCGEDAFYEYYVVRDLVWLEAHPADRGMLCIGCLEDRLGRRLTKDDFSESPINDPTDSTWRSEKSWRLLDRLGYVMRHGPGVGR